MRSRTIPFLITLVFAVSLSDISVSEAQHLRSWQPVQRPLRWLGHGWSAGYHHRNPGPNTDYYNPYTAHNSMLISNQPSYQGVQHQYHHQPMAPGVPYSVYAPTTGAQTDWNYGHAQSINPTFAPSNNDNEEPEDDSDDEADDNNDFDSESMPDVSSDPDEPGSIQVNVDDDDEDADFEESSVYEADDDIESDDDSDFDEDAVKATKTGYSRTNRDNLESLDFSSFMVN